MPSRQDTPEVTRIGVVADSHVGEFLDAMPVAVEHAMAGCDLILHAGDLSVPSVIDDLGRIAPVVAVRGDHDRLGRLGLPEDAVVTVAGRRIALTHGRRPYPLDVARVAVHLAAGRRVSWDAGLHRHLADRFGPVDLIVYGHWHEPTLAQVGDTLVYSPGAVCPWGSLEGGRPVGTGWTRVTDVAVRRYRRQLGPQAMRPSVGMIEIGPEGLTTRVIPLDEVPAPA
jgi:putative phosphoesterase